VIRVLPDNQIQWIHFLTTAAHFEEMRRNDIANGLKDQNHVSMDRSFIASYDRYLFDDWSLFLKHGLKMSNWYLRLKHRLKIRF